MNNVMYVLTNSNFVIVRSLAQFSLRLDNVFQFHRQLTQLHLINRLESVQTTFWTQSSTPQSTHIMKWSCVRSILYKSQLRVESEMMPFQGLGKKHNEPADNDFPFTTHGTIFSGAVWRYWRLNLETIISSWSSRIPAEKGCRGDEYWVQVENKAEYHENETCP